MSDTQPNVFVKAIIWCTEFFRSGSGVSMKRLTIFMAACTLCYTAVRLTHAVCHQIWYNLPLDYQTVALLSINLGILAVMAGVAYFKRDPNGNITIESIKPSSSGPSDDPSQPDSK